MLIFTSTLGSTTDLGFSLMDINFSLIRIVTLISLGLIMILYGSKLKLPKNKYIYFTYIWIFVGIASLVRVNDVESWFPVGLTLILITIWIILFTNLIDIEEDNTLELIIKYYFVSFLFHFIVGFYELTFQKLLFHEDIYARLNLFRPFSTFYNINDYASYLTFSILIILYYLFKTKSIKNKVVLSVLIIMTLFLINYLDSRLNVILGTFYVFAVWIMRVKDRLNFKNIIISLFMIIISIFAIDYILTEINSRDLYEVNSDKSRFNLIKNGIYFVYITFGLGIGLGNVSYYLSNYSIYPVGDLKTFHNFFIEFFASYGVVGMLMFLITYIYILKVSWSISKSKGMSSHFGAIIFIYYLTFFISSSSSSSVMSTEWFWLTHCLMLVIMIKNKNGFLNLKNE